VHQLDNKVSDIIDALCNHEDSFEASCPMTVYSLGRNMSTITQSKSKSVMTS